MSWLSDQLVAFIEASPRQKVEGGALYAAAVAADGRLATAPDARSEIRKALDDLVSAGVVTLPAKPAGYDTSEHPPLPRWVRRPPRPRGERRATPIRVWPAALEAAGRIARRDSELAVLDAIAAFLRDGGESRPSVPARERSVELFGHEKRLDGLINSKLFVEGNLTLELLSCHQVPIPFVSQWVPGSLDPRGTALLIAENHHTYASLLEVTREYDGLGRHVGYGTGGQFPSAVLAVPLLEPAPERIVYFGDLDVKGLEIPAVASLRAERAGLPAVRPALPLYELLFAATCRQPTSPVPADEAAVTAKWLGDLADAAYRTLVGGHRIPQEAVGYELLQRHPGILDLI